MKKRLQTPQKYYLNYDNELPNVDVVVKRLPEVQVTAPRIKTEAEKELEELKDPFALPSFEDYFNAFMESRGIMTPWSAGKYVNPLKRLVAAIKYGLPMYDEGTNYMETDDETLPNTTVTGYHDMYNHSFDNPYKPGVTVQGPLFNKDVLDAQIYTSNWNKYRGSRFGNLNQGEAIRNYFDDVSAYFGRGKGYSAFDKLFRTKKYKNARESWIDNIVLNNPKSGGLRNMPGAGSIYSGEENEIYTNPNVIRDESAYLHELTHARIGNRWLGYNPVYELTKDIIPYEDTPDVSHDYRPAEAIANLYQFRALNNLNPGYKFSKKDIKSLRNGIEQGMITDTGLFSSFSNKQIKKLMNKVWDCGKSIKPARRK